MVGWGYQHESSLRHCDSKFFQVKKTRTFTSIGEIDLPILYFSGTCLVALFLVERSRVDDLLFDLEAKLVPAFTYDNKAWVIVMFFQYDDTTIGPYNEMGIGIPCYMQGREPSSIPFARFLDFYRDSSRCKLGGIVIDLPVSSTKALTVGKELWGYPKFLADISLKRDGHYFCGEVQDFNDKNLICRLSGYTGRLTVPWFMKDLVLFSGPKGNKCQLRTVVNLNSRCLMSGGSSMSFRIGRSTHPMATRLRKLGMEGLNPVLIQFTDRYQARLNQGVVHRL